MLYSRIYDNSFYYSMAYNRFGFAAVSQHIIAANRSWRMGETRRKGQLAKTRIIPLTPLLALE